MSVERLPENITLPTDGTLHVTGLVAQLLRLTIDNLKANYPATTKHASFVDSDQNQTISAAFTGALVFDVLDSAHVRFNPDVKDDLLRFYVTATARDGYQTLFSWGEIAPGFGEQPVLIAYAQDGQLLGEARLIVPGDKRGGRDVKTVISLDVRRAPAVN
ncbi:MAG: molybdopterin-dependent oxidoreductase [Aggregatilineales bacterium]